MGAGTGTVTSEKVVNVLFFADTHLGFDFPIRPRVEKDHRGQCFFDNFRRILEYARFSRPDLVVHGGDLFFRSRLPPKIVDMVYADLMKFSECGIPLFIVPGNHERSRLPPSLWLSAPNIHVFDTPRTFEVAAGGTTVAISGFPFVRHDVRSRFGSILAGTGWHDHAAPVKLLCLHQAIEGAQFGPSNYTFRSGEDVVRMTDLPEDGAAVLSGHIHRRQVLNRPGRVGEAPVIYPGSIERTSFAEKDEPKGFYEISISEVEPARWGITMLNFLPLPSRPMVDIAIDPAIDLANLRDKLIESKAGLPEDSVVRLRCLGEPDERLCRRLTAPFLRSVFPRATNVVLSREFHFKAQRGMGPRPRWSWSV